MSFLLAIAYCFLNLFGYLHWQHDGRMVAYTPVSACVASPAPGNRPGPANVRGYWRGTTVKVIFDGCSASWCTTLCAMTPLVSS
jgi:hypothetical protein